MPTALAFSRVPLASKPCFEKSFIAMLMGYFLELALQVSSH
jgi:hypothetical protein